MITILGTGAMACLFAARLARVESVQMVGTWQAGLAALQADGIWLITERGNQNIHVPVFHESQLPRAARADVALVLVKSYQTERVARQLPTILLSSGIAVTMQNGLGNEEILREEVGSARVGWGVTTHGARLVQPGVVRYHGGGETYLTRHPAPMTELATILTEAGFPTQRVDSGEPYRWGKLVANAAINPLTALLRIPNGELLIRPSLTEVFAAAAQEVAAVAAALGIALPFPDPVAHAQQVAQQTAANHSSMLQDVERGSTTEIMAVNGAVVRLAESLGIPTPVNRLLMNLVLGLGS